MENKKKIIIFLISIVIFSIIIWMIFFNRKKELIFNINIDKTEITVGERTKLSYELNKEGTIRWESNDDSIAKIDNDMVVGVGAGNTIIKGIVTTSDEVEEKIINLLVYYDEKSKVKNILVPEGELFITLGDDYKISFDYEPLGVNIISIDY